jgi:hypothetical protein
MSKNMVEFDNYYKARTHAIINLKASSNYVMCVPNGLKYLSKVVLQIRPYVKSVLHVVMKQA